LRQIVSCNSQSAVKEAAESAEISNLAQEFISKNLNKAYAVKP